MLVIVECPSASIPAKLGCASCSSQVTAGRLISVCPEKKSSSLFVTAATPDQYSETVDYLMSLTVHWVDRMTAIIRQRIDVYLVYNVPSKIICESQFGHPPTN